MSERRRFRRAELNEVVPMSLQPQPSAAAADQIVGRAKNISLAGVLCQVDGPCHLKSGDEVNCHVSIPPPQRRMFPFQRVLGKGHVVRVMPGEGDGASCQLAVAFMPDVTAFGAIEY